MEDTEISKTVRSKWYTTLFEEDCIEVMKLLDDHPNLLKLGWESDPSLRVTGFVRRQGRSVRATESKWKGRTALHVGASRGCTKLVVQVIRSCNFDDFSEIDEAYRKNSSSLEEFSFRSLHLGITCNECDVNPIVGNRWTSTAKADYDLCPDCYEKLGNEKEFIKIQFPEPEPEPKNEHKAVPVSAVPSDRAYYFQDDVFVATPLSSDKDVKSLLLAKDEERGLDAFAIAALHGNQEILVLLHYCKQRVLNSPTAGLETRARLTEVMTSNADKRKLLRQITVRVPGMGSLVAEYESHRDFNFLPPEEYLCHFMFACNRKISFDWKGDLWRAIRSCEGSELWRFVLELKDAQGRPPFHVAVSWDRDCDLSHEELLFRLAKIGRGGSSATTVEEEEVIVCALTTSDAVGRTPVHKAAATGLLRSLKLILRYAARYQEIAATCHKSWTCHTDLIRFINLPKWSIDSGFPLKNPLHCTPLHAG